MKMHKALIILSSVAIVGLIAGMAVAGQGENQRRSPAHLHTAAFAISGTYAGALSGEIKVAGRMVVVPRTVSIYRVGVGPMAPGEQVLGSSVWVSGTMEHGKPVATMIIIGDGSKGHDFSQVTLQNVEADPSRAR